MTWSRSRSYPPRGTVGRRPSPGRRGARDPASADNPLAGTCGSRGWFAVCPATSTPRDGSARGVEAIHRGPHLVVPSPTALAATLVDRATGRREDGGPRGWRRRVHGRRRLRCRAALASSPRRRRPGGNTMLDAVECPPGTVVIGTTATADGRAARIATTGQGDRCSSRCSSRPRTRGPGSALRSDATAEGAGAPSWAPAR